MKRSNATDKQHDSSRPTQAMRTTLADLFREDLNATLRDEISEHIREDSLLEESVDGSAHPVFPAAEVPSRPSAGVGVTISPCVRPRRRRLFGVLQPHGSNWQVRQNPVFAS